MLVATPSGVTLAPEGGAHQSIDTPLIGMGQPGLLAFEPAYVDELAVLMRLGFDHMQAADRGRLGLSAAVDPQPATQPQRTLTRGACRHDIVERRLLVRRAGARRDLAIVCMGAVTPEAIAGACELSCATSPAPACWR